MGFGDDIMALGQAQKLHRDCGMSVRIVGADGRHRWSELWAREKCIVRPGDGATDESRTVRMASGPGARPYIQRWDSWNGKPVSVFSGWRARDCRATWPVCEKDMSLVRDIRRDFGDYIVVEHEVRHPSSPNKSWWTEMKYAKAAYLVGAALQSLVGYRPTIVQVGRPGRRVLPGAEHVPTQSFTDALAVMSGAIMFLGPEGGLHHAAAAVGTKAVVIFGHFASRWATGYAEHLSIGGEVGCGRWAPCSDCIRWMDELSPERVAREAADYMGTEGPVWER